MMPPIDSTPPFPQPLGDSVERAMRDVPEVMANIFPTGTRFEARAGELADRLKDRGHLLAAAAWAITRLVEAGRLSLHQSFGGQFQRTPSTQWVCYTVRAEASLWDSWSKADDKATGGGVGIDYLFLSAADIAKRFGTPPEATRKAIERARAKAPMSEYKEIRNPARGEARFLHRVGYFSQFLPDAEASDVASI